MKVLRISEQLLDDKPQLVKEEILVKICEERLEQNQTQNKIRINMNWLQSTVVVVHAIRYTAWVPKRGGA